MVNKSVLMFVTSNKGKVESANRYFEGKIQFVPCDLAFHEIRSDNLEEIAVTKVKEAYENTKAPTIALDAGFYIMSLQGFPGTYTNYVLETIGIEGLLKLMENVDDRECYFKQCLAYYDGKVGPLIFWGERKGYLSDSVRGTKGLEDWSELSSIFVPEGQEKTLSKNERAQMLAQKDCSYSAFEEFKKWYMAALASERYAKELQWEQQWKKTCKYITEHNLMANISYVTWIKPLRIKECTSDRLIIEYKDDTVFDLNYDTVKYIKHRYGRMLLEVYNLCTESDIQQIEFVCKM